MKIINILGLAIVMLLSLTACGSKGILVETMEEEGTMIPEPEGADAFIVVMGDAARKEGLALMRRLRGEGLKVEMDDMGRNVKNQFKYADRIGARYVVVIGDEELAKGVVTLRDMNNSSQTQVAKESITETIINDMK